MNAVFLICYCFYIHPSIHPFCIPFIRQESWSRSGLTLGERAGFTLDRSLISREHTDEQTSTLIFTPEDSSESPVAQTPSGLWEETRASGGSTRRTCRHHREKKHGHDPLPPTHTSYTPAYGGWFWVQCVWAAFVIRGVHDLDVKHKNGSSSL